MWKGAVLSIHITASASTPMMSVKEIRAVAGKGFEGDRYFYQKGTYSKAVGGIKYGAEATLIEVEAIQALEREYGVKITPAEARRNIVTQGVPLNHLIEQDFHVGSALLRGVRLCEPCWHLAQLTHKRALPGLVHRGGLYAQILRDGLIRVGDRVTAVREK